MESIEISSAELTAMLLILTRIPIEVYNRDPEAATSIRYLVSMIYGLRGTDWKTKVEDRERMMIEIRNH